MEAIIFFLKCYSVAYSITLLGFIYAFLKKKQEQAENAHPSIHGLPNETGNDLTIQFNMNSCIAASLYFTSIYSWFI